MPLNHSSINCEFCHSQGKSFPGKSLLHFETAIDKLWDLLLVEGGTLAIRATNDWKNCIWG